MRSAGHRDIVLQCLQVLHVHVFFVAPLGTGNVPQSCADEHQSRVPVWETSDDSCSPSDLPVESFNHVVRADPCPMLGGKVTVGQRLFNAVLYLLGRLFQLCGSQLCHNGSGFFPRSLFALLSLDRLEHLGNLLPFRLGNNAENITVEVHHATLVFGIRESFSNSLQHAHALVAHNELYTVQTASFEPLKEADSAGFVLFHPIGRAQDFPVAVLIYGNCNQYSVIFILPAPASAQMLALG